MKKILLTLFILVSSLEINASNGGFEVISDLKEIKQERIVVQEFFFYGCPHCQRLEAPLNKWLSKLDPSKVEFEKIPVDYGKLSLLSAKHHYAAKALNRIEDFKPLYFNELVKKRKKISDELAINILVSLGEKENKVKEAMDSFMVKQNIERVKKLTKKYKIYTVPSFVINGKYKVDAQTANGEKNIFNVIDSKLKN
jgi:thiol:disulfide interchange protein DsbA